MFGKGASFTDDTICTVATAAAILTGYNYEDQTLAWCEKYPHPMGGYGGSFARWLVSDEHHPYNSFGNGSAMRVSPVGFAFRDQCDVERQAMASANFTHSHPEGIVGAVCVARAISAMLKAKDKKEAARQIVHYYYPGFEDMRFVRNYFDETCMYCVPLAFRIFLGAESFEDAIRKAVSFGGDSDTLGAIVGGLAVACWGVPSHLWAKAERYLPKEMINVINAFYDTIKVA